MYGLNSNYMVFLLAIIHVGLVDIHDLLACEDANMSLYIAPTHTDYYIGLNNTMEEYMYTPINIFIFHYQHKRIIDMRLLQHPVCI